MFRIKVNQTDIVMVVMAVLLAAYFSYLLALEISRTDPVLVKREDADL